MNCPVDYDNKAERKMANPGLLPKEESYGTLQGTMYCMRKPGAGMQQDGSLNRRGKTSLKRKVSWRSPLIQYKNVSGDDSFSNTDK